MIYVIASILILAGMIVVVAGCINGEPPVQNNFETGDGVNAGIEASGRVSGTRAQPSDMSANHGHEHSRQSDSNLRPVSKIIADNFIEPLDLIDSKEPCSWCQKELATKAQPHESHGICKRHAAEMLADLKRITKAD